MGLIFRQLFDRSSCTYTYLLGAGGTGVLVDPVNTKVERDLQFVAELGIKLKYVVNTHVHADHVTAGAMIKQRLPGVKSVLGAATAKAGAKADMFLADGELLEFGGRGLRAVPTSGHTEGCTSFVLDDDSMVLTGDTLFVRGCGRTDFQGGSSETLYDSVHKRLFTLPDDCIVYPGHDYNGRTASTIGEEKRLNPRLTKSKADFVELMAALGLASPKFVDVAVPANLVCGYVTSAEPTAGLAAAYIAIGDCTVVDLRTEAEAEAEAGIAGATLVPVPRGAAEAANGHTCSVNGGNLTGLRAAIAAGQGAA